MLKPVLSRRALAESIALALVAAPVGLTLPARAAEVVEVAGEGAVPMFCGSGGTAAKAGQLGLVEDFGGWTLAEVTDPASQCTLKATTAGLYVQFPAATQIGSQSVTLVSAPSFDLTAKRFSFGFVEPVLCESYYTGSDALTLRASDPTGRSSDYAGLQSLAYTLPVAGDASTARLTPTMLQATYGPWVQCYAVPFSTLVANPADVPAPSVAPSEVVLSDGFEDQVAAAMRADLQVEILDGSNAYLSRQLTQFINTPFQYAIRIRNLGLATANGVRVKEFVSDAGSLTPLVSAGAWTCTDRTAAQAQTDAGTACGSGSGVLAVGGTGFSLAAGASRTYTLTRNIASGTTGQRTVLAAAAFYDPANATSQGDPTSSNNLASAVISLVQNQAPTISCVANPGGTALASPVSFLEDGAPLSFNCTLTDTDTPLSLAATSSNTALIANTGLLGSPTGNTWPLTLAPLADQSGTTTVTLTAADGLGAQRQLAITVNVTEVNDPPSFDITGLDTSMPTDGTIDKRIYRIGLLGSGGTPFLFAADGSTISLPGAVARDANCGGVGACSLRFVDFFRFVDAGSAPEAAAGQQVDVELTACDDPALNDYFFADARSNQTVPMPWSATAGPRSSGSNYDLVLTYDKSQVGSVDMRCNFRFKDTGSPSATSVDSPGSNGLTEIHFLGFAGS